MSNAHSSVDILFGQWVYCQCKVRIGAKENDGS